jgi:hypothetical protein
MKHLFKACISAIFVTVAIICLSSFNTKKVNTSNAVASYIIGLQSIQSIGANYVWEWSLYNPNPGNGQNGTLQNLRQWDIPLNPAAEAALVSAEYSTNGGITWVSVPIIVENDPSITNCTGEDVLIFDANTVGTQPNLYRVTFNSDIRVSAFATSYVKSFGGVKGCNINYFAGVGGTRLY